MNKSLLKTIALSASLFMGGSMANAQLAKDHPCKFLGNITTSYNWQEYCDPQDCNGSYKYSDYWDQVTCENATKWGSVHSGWGKFNWDNADRTYNYCKQHGVMFKFHALVWGSQYPSWIKNLSVNDTKKAIVEWFDEVKKHYPDLKIIDVVNEAIYSGSDYHSPYKETKIIEALTSLANDRLKTNYQANTNGYRNNNDYQWIAEAFRMARERWPEAILIYNDYNTFQWQKTEFINLINGLKACGAPIDAAGNQSHDLNDMGGSQFKTALYEIHDKTNLPQYITEYDIAKSDDATFKTRYSEQFPIMWEADFVAGVTLWGWIYGKTWTTNGNSGLIRDCNKRSAFTWLEEYMKSDKAKKAPMPEGFCGVTKTDLVGVTVSFALSNTTLAVGETLTISVTSSSNDSKIKFVSISANDENIVDKWVSPEKFDWTFTPTEPGTYVIKVTAYDENDKSTEKTEEITVCAARGAYKGVVAEIPGTIEAENFDEGCPGDAFYDSDDINEGDEYRTTGEAFDVVKGNNGYALGYTAIDEWVEYTVDVKESGSYKYKATVASGSNASTFHLEMDGKAITEQIKIPQGEDWNTYSEVEGDIIVDLKKGEQVMRLVIDGMYCNIDKIEFICADCGSSDDPDIPDINLDEVQLYAGWNLIGCPLEGATAIESALSSIWKNVEVVKDMESFYLKSGDETFNLLKDLYWGRGYLVKVSTDCVLTWK